jgi:hypothetical protein
MLLCAFKMAIEANNMFARYRVQAGGRSPFGGLFSRHDFQPKQTPCELNVWGTTGTYGVFTSCFGKVLQGKEFARQPYDMRHIKDGKRVAVPSAERVYPSPGQVSLEATSATMLASIGAGSVPLVITDPPYAGNVNYAELTDFFHVWLRLLLADKHVCFAPEDTPKAEEIIENPARGKTAEDFEQGLTAVFRQCHRVLKDDGLMVFTFHHSEERAWEALLRAVINAGFEIVGVFPVHGEAESSTHLMGTEGIAYDLIHVCRKRDPQATIEPRSWAGIRQEVRRNARREIEQIEAGRYGREPLSPADVRIILIGKCLELYSRHYGAVIVEDEAGNRRPLELREALEEIRMMVDQLVSQEQPLPPELQDIDPESYIYLTALAGHAREVKADEVHKATRGIMEVDRLRAAGLIIKGRTGRGRTYEVKPPHQRLSDLLEKFGDGARSVQGSFLEEPPGRNRDRVLFIDKLHLLMALAETGENLTPWLERFRGDAPQLRAACQHLKERRRDFAPALDRILRLMDLGPLFRGG